MPVYRLLPIDDCIIDPRYQRDKKEHHIERIVREFDDAKFNVLEASERPDGKCAIFDGQQRLEARRRRRDRGLETGEIKLPALVHTGLTPEQEAELFVELQERRKAITPLERFYARVFYGDPNASKITEICQKHRWKVGNGKSAINAVVALERAYKRGNLEDTLKVLSVWRGDPGDTEASLINGVSRFIDLFGAEASYTLDHLRFVASNIAPKAILRRANERSAGSKAGGVVMVLRDEFSDVNHRLPSVEDAIAARTTQETEGGRRYVRVSEKQVRDAVVALDKISPYGWRIEELQEFMGGISKAVLTRGRSGGHLSKMIARKTVRYRLPVEGEAPGRIYFLAPVSGPQNRTKVTPPEKYPPAGTLIFNERGVAQRIENKGEKGRQMSTPGARQKKKNRDRAYERQQAAREERSERQRQKKFERNGGKPKEPVAS